jgi:hypothetical protein
MNGDWARGNEEILGKVVENRSGYGGRLETLVGFSDLGSEVTDFDKAHLQPRMDYERDAHCSIQSRSTDSYILNAYSYAFYTIGNENSILFNTSENLISENNVDLENEVFLVSTW